MKSLTNKLNKIFLILASLLRRLWAPELIEKVGQNSVISLKKFVYPLPYLSPLHLFVHVNLKFHTVQEMIVFVHQFHYLHTKELPIAHHRFSLIPLSLAIYVTIERDRLNFLVKQGTGAVLHHNGI